jgi:hypothetical protein
MPPDGAGEFGGVGGYKDFTPDGAGEKRWRVTAVQNAGAFTVTPGWREASWSAPALWRFGRSARKTRDGWKCWARPVSADWLRLIACITIKPKDTAIEMLLYSESFDQMTLPRRL